MSTKVTAKVKLASKTTNANGYGANLSFQADYQDGRNKEWAEATPALGLTMTVKGSVADLFTQGQAYTLTFERSED